MNPTRIAAAVLLAAYAPSIPAHPSPDSLAPFAGSWKGRGEQSDEPGGWTIAATIAPGRVGDVVGTITYPSLSCGGDWVLRSAAADSVVLGERITFGHCTDEGIVTLRRRAPGYLAYEWRSETSELTARGQLGPAGRPE